MTKNVPYWKMIPLQAVIGASLLILNCATDKVSWDLMEYVNQDILNIAELEKNALDHYAMARSAHFITEQNLYHVLKQDVIPPYARFLHLLKQIKPKTKEVKKLHWIYVSGTESIYQGFELKMIGLKEGDEQFIRAGNEKIEKGRKQNEKWHAELETMSEAHQRGWVIDLWDTP